MSSSAQPCGCDPGFESTDGQMGWWCAQHMPTPFRMNVSRAPVTSSDTPTGDPDFHAILNELGALHDQKMQDYGTPVDPYANVRASAEWGIIPWIGALIRATDKVKRLQKFARVGNLANEGVEDSFKDLAVYAIIGLLLFREEKDA